MKRFHLTSADLVDWLCILAAWLVLLWLVTGCVVGGKQVVDKSTTFGIDLTTPMGWGVRAGIIRRHYVTNPTSTNQLYAAPLESRMTLTNGWWSPTASENVEAGR